MYQFKIEDRVIYDYLNNDVMRLTISKLEFLYESLQRVLREFSHAKSHHLPETFKTLLWTLGENEHKIIGDKFEENHNGLSLDQITFTKSHVDKMIDDIYDFFKKNYGKTLKIYDASLNQYVTKERFEKLPNYEKQAIRVLAKEHLVSALFSKLTALYDFQRLKQAESEFKQCLDFSKKGFHQSYFSKTLRSLCDDLDNANLSIEEAYVQAESCVKVCLQVIEQYVSVIGDVLTNKKEA